MARKSLQVLLTRKEFEKLSVGEMVVYRRELTVRIHRLAGDDAESELAAWQLHILAAPHR